MDKLSVSEWNAPYQFVFTGVDAEDEVIKLDSDVKKVTAGFVAMQDKFKEYTGREFNPDEDIILNPIYNQQKQMQAYGGQSMNNLVDKESGGENHGVSNPFDQFSNDMVKGKSSDPITQTLIDYVNKELTVR